MSHAFEAKVPFHCLMDVITIVRAGQLAEKKLEVAQHAAWFIGCSAEVLKNRPPVFSSEELPEEMTEGEIADQLSTLIPVTDSSVISDDESPAAIDPATLITIITLVLKLFANRKK